MSSPQAHFVGPDNGVFEMIYQREPTFDVRHVTAKRYFREPISQTFHGRDIFAPVAAWLSTGIDPCEFGGVIGDYARLHIPRPEHASASLVRGAVLRVDKFGNLITNFTSEHLSVGVSFCLLIGDCRVTRLVHSYAAGGPGELVAILGSAGLIEIALRQASAAETLGVSPGVEVNLVLN